MTRGKVSKHVPQISLKNRLTISMIPSTHLLLINKVKPTGTRMRASKEIISNVKSVYSIF